MSPFDSNVAYRDQIAINKPQGAVFGALLRWANLELRLIVNVLKNQLIMLWNEKIGLIVSDSIHHIFIAAFATALMWKLYAMEQEFYLTSFPYLFSCELEWISVVVWAIGSINGMIHDGGTFLSLLLFRLRIERFAEEKIHHGESRSYFGDK